MEHIVQFAIGIDDDTIRKRIEDSAVDAIVKKFYEEVRDSLMHIDFNRVYYDDTPLDARNGIKHCVEKNIEKIVCAYKDVIIAEAADALADKLLKTKAAKELLTKEINK